MDRVCNSCFPNSWEPCSSEEELEGTFVIGALALLALPPHRRMRLKLLKRALPPPPSAVAVGDDSLVGALWPLNDRSAPVWAAIAVILFTLWAANFLLPTYGKQMILKERAKKRSQVERMISAVLEYVQAEEKKANAKERKMPESERLYHLLWDETYERRTSDLGSIANHARIEAVLKRVLADELRVVLMKTKRARDRERKQEAAEALVAEEADMSMADALKELGEHESGEKLLEAIENNKKIARQLGSEFVDKALLAEAKRVSSLVSYEQRQNQDALVALVRPVLPAIIVTCAAQILNSSLRGAFHSIGNWTRILELGKAGEMAVAVSELKYLWIGHLVIEFVERLSSCWSFRARSSFQMHLKNGAIAAIVRQDYEYFDKTSPGVLQERLNRDTDALGNNLISFPQRMFEKLSWISVNIAFVYMQCPTRLFVAAMAPLMVMVPLQYGIFKWQSKVESRMNRVDVEATASTGEVLREIKMVRQFAMEKAEAVQHSRAQLTRHVETEAIHTTIQLTEWGFWSVFVSGLILTMYMGIPYVASGAMTVSELCDIIFRINCHLSFPVREVCAIACVIGAPACFPCFCLCVSSRG